jgi:hypothetical protein
MTVKFVDEARQEFLDAIRYYEEAQPGLGSRLSLEPERIQMDADQEHRSRLPKKPQRLPPLPLFPPVQKSEIPSSRLRTPSAAFASLRLKNPRLPIQNSKFKIQSPAPVRR